MGSGKGSGDRNEFQFFSRTTAHDSDSANGLDGRTSSGYRFFDRLYVQGRRQRFGIDATFTPGAWTIAAEGLRASDQRSSRVSTSKTCRRSSQRDGALRPTTASAGGAAARACVREIDVGLRFDWLSFDDSDAATGRDSVRLRATDVRPRSASTLTAGVSWRPRGWGRVLGNASLERYGRPRSAPEPGKTRAVTSRSQRDFRSSCRSRRRVPRQEFDGRVREAGHRGANVLGDQPPCGTAALTAAGSNSTEKTHHCKPHGHGTLLFTPRAIRRVETAGPQLERGVV